MIACNLLKMNVDLKEGIVQYFLPLNNGKSFFVNDLIGKNIIINYKTKINCIHCGIETKESHNQGYCYECSQKLAECDTCRVKPELCSYYAGNCRDEKWGEENCLKEHLVYLSFTGGRKVGISRHMNLEKGYSSRWIDQGATTAIPFLRVKDRLISGEVEIAITEFIGDKTDYRKMLKLQLPDKEMVSFAKELKELVRPSIEKLQNKYGLTSIQWVDIEKAVDIEYPSIGYPEKIKTINLDKTPIFEGKLIAIKGQYLIFENGMAINFRKYAGYFVEIELK